MRIISWNVNGIRSVVKKGFSDSVKKINPDILCLQETKAQNEEVTTAINTLSDYQLTSNSAVRKGYSGTAILTKVSPENTIFDIGIKEHDQEGRVITAEFSDFFIVNVYVPNSGRGLVRLEYRAGWDKDFLNYLKSLEEKKPVIVCGDLNVAHQPIDLKNDKSNYDKTAGYTQIEIDGFSNFLKAGFIDTFRYHHPEEIAYSYWSYMFNARAKNVGWRIDYFLVSKRIIDNVRTSFIFPEYTGSDHCPVGIELEF